MSWLSVAAARMRGLFGRGRMERELDAEVRFHLEMQIEENIKAGMRADDARYAALRSFGAMDAMKEDYRERKSIALLETTAQDIRYAARTLRRSPGFAVTSIAVLALAIGANTAMFSVLNAVLLRDLPYQAPEQLAMLWTEVPSQGVREGRTAYRSIEEWRAQARSFADIAFFDGVSVMLTSETGTEQISGERISPNLLALLGVQPVLGRTFSAEEAEQRQRLVLISHRFWQTRFGGSEAAIGASLELDGVPFRVLGVMPASYLSGTDVWQAYTMFPDWEAIRRARGPGFWSVIARLKPGVSFEQAQAEMNAVARVLDEQSPAGGGSSGISVTPLSLHYTDSKTRLALWMLTGVVFCVLLIAATNIASLSLARSAKREREIAIRAALGAGRGRIVRQLLAEGVTLAGIAGVLGLTVAAWGIQIILAVKPSDLIRLNETNLDSRVFGAAMALCLLTGILVGLAPAITLGRRKLRPSGQEGGRGIAGGAGTARIRRALVVAQFALAIMLLIGAGLLIRSLNAAARVELGFKPDRVLSMQLATKPSGPAGARGEFYRRVLEEIESLPGIESAGIIGDLFVGGNAERMLTKEGDSGIDSERLRFRMDEVSRGLFTTLGTPLLRGRLFSDEDGPDSPRTAIINETMARRMWPGRDPIGTRFKLGPKNSPGPWFTVIGVVGDMRRQGLEREPIPQIFEAVAQNPSRLATLLVRTSMDDPLKLAGAVRAAVGRVEKHAAVYGVTTLDHRLDGFLAERRFQTSLLIGFSLAALLIAAIGIYGLTQYSIAARTHEIGIRMAVGAQAGVILRMILGEGLKLSLTGLAVGLLGALWLGRAGSSLLFGVSASDPLTYAGVSALLIAVAVAACYFPARRAMRIEPVVALRHE